MSENKNQAANSPRDEDRSSKMMKAISPPDTPAGRGPKGTVLEVHGYKVGKTLGYGSYAVVKAAVSERHGCKVAIKIVSKKRAPKDYIYKFLPREIEVVKHLKHPNLVTFYQSIETNNRVYLIMEMATNGDLLDVIKKYKKVQENQAGLWFMHLLEGLDHMHSQGIVHRDLKCENVLLDCNNNLKITDFGFARPHMLPLDGKPVLSETFCGSYAYAAPEILTGTPYEPQKSDIWSMGVILFTMLFGRLPFDDSNHKQLLKQVHKEVVFPSKYEKDISLDCRNLIQKKILIGLKTRITLSEMRRDNWFVTMTMVNGAKQEIKKESKKEIKEDSKGAKVKAQKGSNAGLVRSKPQGAKKSKSNPSATRMGSK